MLSLVVPVYNEAGNLPKFVAATNKCLGTIEHELIIVDDNSPDGTGKLAEELAQRCRNIKVIHRPGKLGVASAIAEGARMAKGRVIGTINADMQHPPDYLPLMLDQLSEHDVVIGSRFVPGGKTSQRLERMMVSRAAIVISRLLLPPIRKVNDPMSGYFLFKREVIAESHVLLSPRSGNMSIGVKYLLELLVKGKYKRVVEVPISFERRNSGSSKFTSRDCFTYLRYVFHLMKTSGELRRMLKFGLVGACGVAINMGMLYLLTEMAGLPYVISAIFSWETAIISMFSLHEAWTFHDLKSGTRAHLLERGIKFNLVRLTSLGIILAILVSLTEILSVYYLMSYAVAIMIATTWNYLASLNLIWKR